MDSKKERRSPHLRGFKPVEYPLNHPCGKNSYNVRSKYVHFKSPRAPKLPYNRKNEFNGRANFNSAYSHRKGVDTSERANSSPEDDEEEERKKKLSDAANKLLSKLKTWSAMNNMSEDFIKSGNDSEQISDGQDDSKKINYLDKYSDKSNEKNRTSAENNDKPRRIAHSKTKTKLNSAKKLIPKNTNEIVKTPKVSKKYQVNKETLKDFQKRIQHKLINELRKMPKENLQKVLNDPKIDPRMESKMSCLVKENKLLIAQKLRALAESKMTSHESVTSSQLLDDIDKLINPVVETDLSVLPYELIKELENIFQVQFDYSSSRTSSESEPTIFDVQSDSGSARLEQITQNGVETDLGFVSNLENHLSNSAIQVNDYGFDLKNDNTSSQAPSVVFVENTDNGVNTETPCLEDDVTVYNCSTDEDEEVNNYSSSSNICEKEIKEVKKEITIQDQEKNDRCRTNFEVGKQKFLFDNNDSRKRRKLSKNSNDDLGSTNTHKAEIEEGIGPNLLTDEFSLSEQNNLLNLETSSEEQGCKETITEANSSSIVCSSPSLVKELISTYSQTEVKLSNIGTQTTLRSSHLDNLYEVPRCTDDNADTLISEVNAIQNVINKLNERRFMIFLELSKTSSLVELINDKFTYGNFVETISNGNGSLLETLRRFFIKNNKVKPNTRKRTRNKEKPSKYKSKNSNRNKTNNSKHGMKSSEY